MVDQFECWSDDEKKNEKKKQNDMILWPSKQILSNKNVKMFDRYSRRTYYNPCELE